MSTIEIVVAEPTGRLKKSILAGCRVGLNWGQVSSLNQLDSLAAVKAREFVAAPGSVLVELDWERVGGSGHGREDGHKLELELPYGSWTFGFDLIGP